MSSPGLFDNVASGYELAWAERRRLAPVLLPVVALILLASSLPGLVSALPGLPSSVPGLMSSLPGLAFDGDPLVVVDGIAEFDTDGGSPWATLVVAVLSWLVGLIAGTWTIRRGTRLAEAFWHAVKHLPSFAMGVVVAAGAVLLALWAIARTATGTFAVVLVFAVLAAVVVTAARVLLSMIGWAVEGSDRMPAWGETGSFLLGGVGVPVLFAYLVSRSSTAAAPYLSAPVVACLGAAFDAVLLLVALAWQVALAAGPFERDAPQRRPAWLWPGIVVLTIAVLVPGAARAMNPYDAPTVRTNSHGPAMPVAVAWPAGRQPVIATMSGVWFCDDALCTESTVVRGGPTVMEGVGTAVIGADGTVVKTTVSGGRDRGGPFVHYARCVREGCREAWVPIRTSASEKLDAYGEVAATGAAAPDGTVWLFAVAPVVGGKTGRYRFTMIRCTAVPCAAPERHQVGTVDHPPRDRPQYRLTLRLSVGADGRPVALFSDGRSVHRYSCEPVTCAAPQTSTMIGPSPDAPWDVAGDEVVSYRNGMLRFGNHASGTTGSGPHRLSAVAVAGPYVFVVGQYPTDRPQSGFHVTVGEPAKYWRQYVQRCQRLRCESTSLDRYEAPAQSLQAAVADDGRVLIVRDDHIALLETPF